MKIVQKSILSETEKKKIWQLRNNEYPLQLGSKTFQDFEMYLDNLKNLKHFFLLDQENEINAWAYTFLCNEKTWIQIIRNSQIIKRGYLNYFLSEITKYFQSLNTRVFVNDKNLKTLKGDPYKSQLIFYLKNGFIIFSVSKIDEDQGVRIMSWGK